MHLLDIILYFVLIFIIWNKVDFDLSDFKFYCDSMVYRNGVPKFPEVDEWKWVTLDEARKIFSG